MNEELKQKWIEALRSGKYKQGHGQLRDLDNRYCCLGVLCDVQGRKWRRQYGDEWGIGNGAEFDSGGEANNKLLNDIGGREIATKLIRMNDGQDKKPRSFKQIANYIEKHL